MRLRSSKLVKSVVGVAAAAVLIGGGIFVGASVANAAQSEINANNSASLKGFTARTEPNASSFSNSSWVTIASSTVVVNNGQNASIIDVRFSAQSKCEAPGGSWCAVRVLLASNNAEFSPSNGAAFAFDIAGSVWGGKSMERVMSGFFSGSVPILLQVQVTNGAGGGAGLRLQHWSLVTQAI